MKHLFIASLLAALTSSAEGPGVVLLLSAPDAAVSHLVEQRNNRFTELAAVAHVRGGVAKGMLLKDGVAVIAQREERRDVSWGSSLLIVDSKGRSRELVDRVAHASTPVIAPTGEIVVNRGVAGEEPAHSKGFGALLRQDALTVEAVHPMRGTRRVLLRRSGYLLFVAGVTPTEVLVYAIGPGSTPLLAVDLKTLAVRTVASQLDLARDFSVDGSHIVFTERDAEGWRVVRLSIATGERRQLHAGRDVRLMPFAIRPGLVATATERGVTLSSGELLPCPHGEGRDEVRARSLDGRFLAALHHGDSGAPLPVLFDLQTKTGAAVPVPADVRAEVVGVRP